MTLRPMELRRLRKRLRSAGSRPAVGSSTMMSLGLASERLGDAEALLHAAGVGAEGFFARFPEIGLIEESVDHFFAFAGVGDSLHDGEVMKHVDGVHFRVHAEFLREVAEDLADGVFLLEDVEVVEPDFAFVGILERGDGAHERAFAGAVGAEQAEHVVADGERDVAEGFDAVGIGFGEAGDFQRHLGLLGSFV